MTRERSPRCDVVVRTSTANTGIFASHSIHSFLLLHTVLYLSVVLPTFVWPCQHQTVSRRNRSAATRVRPPSRLHQYVQSLGRVPNLHVPQQAVAQRYEPYKPTKTRARKPRTALSKYLATPPPRPSPQWPPPMNEEPDENAPTLREVSLGLVRKLYPNITPRDDFDILTLAAGQYSGEPSNEAAYKWLDATLRCEESTWPPECKTLEQGRAVTVSEVKITLDRRVQITGVRSVSEFWTIVTHSRLASSNLGQGSVTCSFGRFLIASIRYACGPVSPPRENTASISCTARPVKRPIPRLSMKFGLSPIQMRCSRYRL